LLRRRRISRAFGRRGSRRDEYARDAPVFCHRI
jgi:hypothetical protein